MSARDFCSATALAAMLIAAAVPAPAASLFELNFYLPGPRFDGVVPPCDASEMLRKMASNFADKEQNFWQSNLTILGYEKVRETSFRPWHPHSIPRRFCSAVAIVSDGLRHPIHYAIGEDTGWLGVTWGVQWCIVGLDRNWAYNPGCLMAQP
jgi:hypothetical protein